MLYRNIILYDVCDYMDDQSTLLKKGWALISSIPATPPPRRSLLLHLNNWNRYNIKFMELLTKYI